MSTSQRLRVRSVQYTCCEFASSTRLRMLTKSFTSNGVRKPSVPANSPQLLRLCCLLQAAVAVLHWQDECKYDQANALQVCFTKIY